ncbi:hypothetical protein Taro_017378 [Colocasia esculenta]|uniref:Uncharacterized protein n=1 Tax=Colocasia esculenta TaxID=4460 RepID=A0A843UNG6_COLES|nr:hypothetical protein [Colocasia esculenta]
MSLHLVGVMWRSSWQLGEQEIPTPSRSSSPLCLLRPAQIVILKSTKAAQPTTAPDSSAQQPPGEATVGAIHPVDSTTSDRDENTSTPEPTIVSEAPVPTTPVHDNPTAPSLQQAAPGVTKHKGKRVLNAASPSCKPAELTVQQTPTAAPDEECLLNDPYQLADFLKTIPTKATPSTFDTPPGGEALPSPTVLRMSFVDALRKKTKRGDINMMKNIPPPPCFSLVASSMAAPIRTRSITVLNMDSDGEYEDFSD